MHAQTFHHFWQQCFSECLPVSYLFKYNLADRWLRIHSLSESKRYAETQDEYNELLMRQNTLLFDIIGVNSLCVLVFGNYSSSPPLANQCSAIQDIALQELITLPKQVFAPEAIMSDEEPVSLHLFYATHLLQPASLNTILLCVAEWQIVNFFVVSLERKRIFAPYDGGVDLILRDAQERDSFKVKYHKWLSQHPAGL